jgi:UDPglucose 6-dehydrogenase
MESRVAVIGTGYVGLTTGACFAHLGHAVICADIDEDKVERLTRGEIPIHEPGLEEIVRAGIDSGKLRFTADPVEAAREADFIYLCVPTPQGNDGSADLSYLEAAARQVGPHLRSDAIVVNKSTVPVGSAGFVEQVMGRSDVHVVSNPEFLREGTAVHDFLHPDRVVIGAEDQSAAVRIAGLYLGLPAPFMVTDPASAETIKYASNAFLAMKLSFVNAIANLCEAVGADVNDVVLGMGYDKRIGHEFLRPGPGWGGSCFPKDSKALQYIARDNGYEFSLIDALLEQNAEQFDRVADKVTRFAGGDLEGVTVAAWGLTFKADTDDRRQSPAIEVLPRRVAGGARVKAFDPTVSASMPELPEVEVAPDPYAACEGADVLVVLTEWDDFKWLDLDKVADVMANRRIVDGRNLLDRAAVRRRGFEYEGIGRL